MADWCRPIRLGGAIMFVAVSAGGRDDGPSADDPESDVVVATFEVANGERFAVELATPELVDHAAITSDQFCPWSARVVEVGAGARHR